MGRIIRERITKNDDNAWHDYRSNYCNASEIGVILGLSKYQISADLLLKKTGWKDDNRDGNKFTVAGQLFEDVIAEAWQYYDFSNPDAYILNYKHRNKIRRCERKNGSLRNTDFPWISASLDRVIKIGDVNLMDGSELEKQCPLELKFLDRFVMSQFESGIPPVYIVQLMTQMMVANVDYGELFIMSSDRDFHLFPIDFRPELGESIKEHTKIFHSLISRGKELKGMYDQAMLDGKKQEAAEIELEMESICPRPRPGQEELYKQFLNEQYQKSEVDSFIMGSEKDLEVAKELVYLQELEKEMKGLLESKKNHMKLSMKTNETMNFDGTNFSLNWKANINGVRVFKPSKPKELGEIDVKIDLKEFCDKKKIAYEPEK